MSIESAIVSLLTADAALVARIGKRLRPLVFTQLDRRPAVAYQVVDTEQFDHFNGSAVWERATMQIDVFADTYSEAKSVASLVKSVLNNYVGTVEGIEIGFAKHKGDTDLTDPPEVGSEHVVRRLSSNYLILYRGE